MLVSQKSIKFAFVKLKDTVRRSNPDYKNPSRYRLDFIKENTFNRVWSLRMTRTRVFLVTAAIIAGGAALLWVIIAYTPVRRLLPGTLKGDLRTDYITAAIKLDSLEQASARNAAYIANIAALLQGDEMRPDSATINAVAIEDSLLAASEAERQFVRSFEAQERFNLSVLAPIAAEGMIFTSPAAATATTETSPTKSLQISGSGTVPLSAIYRGTIVGLTISANGSSTIIIQHPNDFVSVYMGVGDVFVERGNKVEPGQRLGHAFNGKASFELWHKGSQLNPEDYINI